jgi:hypothetical protein
MHRYEMLHQWCHEDRRIPSRITRTWKCPEACCQRTYGSALSLVDKKSRRPKYRGHLIVGCTRALNPRKTESQTGGVFCVRSSSKRIIKVLHLCRYFHHAEQITAGALRVKPLRLDPPHLLSRDRTPSSWVLAHSANRN